MKNNFKLYLFSGILLTYFGLKGEFILLYNGIALLMAGLAFYHAFLEYRKKNTES